MDLHASQTVAESTLGDTLARLRTAGFVGRERELETFRALLKTPPPFRVLLVNGDSGVGKTVLLQGFRREAERHGFACTVLDARDLPTDPMALARAMDRHRVSTVDDAVLLIDTFEALAGHERWLREEYLTGLPGNARVVIAGRWEPAPAWQTDPGWSAMTRCLTLADFDAGEVRDVLQYKGLDPYLAESVHNFTHGHPLAVGMVAALLHQNPARTLDLESTPELVHALVGRTIDEAGDHQARRALYAAGISRSLSEPMLAALLGVDDASALYETLARNSFMRSGPGGLWPHELVGDALRVELKRRDPALHRTLVRRAADYLAARFAEDESAAALEDYLFTVRELPAVRSVFVVDQDTGLSLDRATDQELPQLGALIARHEGPTSKAWFDFWVARQPTGLRVLRNTGEEIVGLVFHIDVSAPSAEERADPTVARFTDYVARHAPLRGGEQAHLCRFVMGCDAYQSPSCAMTQLLAHNALRAFREPQLAIQATVRCDDERARAQARLARVPPLPDCTVHLDGADFFLMGHDWRVEPPSQWLRNVTDRLLADDGDSAYGDSAAGILDAETLHTETASALRAHAKGQTLASSGLLRTCVVGNWAAEAPDGTIAELLEEGVRLLAEQPDTAIHARVLERTYLRPAPKQRAAAHAVGLSYGTYRRRLREAERLLADRIWEMELDCARAQRG